VVIVYFVICVLLVTAGSLTKNFNYVQLSILPIGLIAIAFQKFVHRGKIRDLGFNKTSVKRLIESAFIPAAVIVLIILIDWIFGLIKTRDLAEIHNPFSRGEGFDGVWPFVFAVAVSALFTFIAALITEELAFRGYILTKLRKLGDRRSLWLSSLLFGAWHYPAAIILWDLGIFGSTLYVLNISLLGVLFGYVFLKSKSLVACSISHAVWNALEYSLFGVGNTEGLFAGSSRVLFDPEEGIIGTVVLTIVALVLALRTEVGAKSA